MFFYIRLEDLKNSTDRKVEKTRDSVKNTVDQAANRIKSIYVMRKHHFFSEKREQFETKKTKCYSLVS